MEYGKESLWGTNDKCILCGMTRTVQRWSLILAAVVLLTLPCGAGNDEGPLPYRWDDVERVVALGDVHGALEPLVSVLQSTGLVDPALHWSGGRTHLVSLGDLTDRGPDSRAVMDLLIRLQTEAEVAGGRVHVLLSNHEVMGVAGDLRYTTEEDFATWKDLEDAGVRDQAWSRFRASGEGVALKQRPARRRFDALFPPGFFGRIAAFSSSGQYGRWIRDLPAVIVVNRIAFVHAGFSAESTKLGGAELNRLHTDTLGTLMEDRETLTRNGALPPETAFAFQTSVLFEKLEESDPEIRRIGFRYLELLNSILFRPDGPLWYRGTAHNPEYDEAPIVDQALDALSADRLVIGHTVTSNNRVTSRFGGKVLRLDTGMNRQVYGGYSAALTFEDDAIQVVYPDEGLVAEPLPEAKEPEWKPDELEAFLSTAELILMEDIGTGITKPKRITLRAGNRKTRAIFKSVDVSLSKVTRVDDRIESRFKDSYRYEAAAYIIDKLLGLDMVPVTVIRDVSGTRGSVQYWLEDVVPGTDFQPAGEQGGFSPSLTVQEQRMHIFDFLIFNIDRNRGNKLYARDGSRLHLIDHSRAFRQTVEQPPGLEGRDLVLDPELRKRLAALDPGKLRSGLKGILTRPEISAVLQRRDMILQEIGPAAPTDALK
jgi:hypothetical protein